MYSYTRMLKFLIPALAAFFGLCSCDAIIRLSYVVENHRQDTVLLHTAICCLPFDAGADTLICLAHGEQAFLGSRQKLDFPWAHRAVYKVYPAPDKLYVTAASNHHIIDISSRRWTYTRGCSILKLKQ